MAGGSTALATLFGVPAAWAYSRFELRAKKDQLFFILSTRFMPPVVVVIPVFLMYRQLGLINTKLGLVLIYAAFNVSFTIWMMKGFVDEVPSEYEDAAMLDGYTRLQAFWRFTLPLLVPGIAATAVFALIFSWNEFVFAIFLTSSQDVRTAPPAIAGLIGGTTVDWGLVAASADGVRDPGAGVRLPGAQAPRRRRDARGGASLMAGIEVTSLHKRYPDGTVAVEHVDLSIGDGELFVMLGPSGCGKTTTLRAMAGLERQTSGDIRIGSTLVNDLPPGERDIAMVFQFYALYPHLKVRDNLAFPLRAEGLPEPEVRQRVEESARDDGARFPPGPPAAAAVRRGATAGRAGPRPRAPPACVPHGRAPHQPGRGAEGGHADPDQAPAGRARDDDGLRHPRPGRGHVARSPHRHPQPGPGGADRHTAGGLRPSGEPLLRRLHRLPADEPDRGRGGRRGAARSGRARLTPPPGLPRDASLVAGVRPEALEVTVPGAERSIPARVVSAEALGDEIIYVVAHGGQRDVRVRMPPTVRFAADAPVGLRHAGGTPPVYDKSTEELVA